MNHLAMKLSIIVALLTACDERPACRPEELARIEGAFVMEALKTCEGHELSDCPDYPAIKAKYATQRDAWVNCQ